MTGKSREKWIRIDCPEQKSVCWKQDLVNLFSKPDDLVTDLFSSTSAAAKACLYFSRHSQFVGYKVHVDWFAAGIKSLVEKYATQVWNEKLGIFSSDEVLDACKTVDWAFNRLRAREWMRSWKMSSVMLPV